MSSDASRCGSARAGLGSNGCDGPSARRRSMECYWAVQLPMETQLLGANASALTG